MTNKNGKRRECAIILDVPYRLSCHCTLTDSDFASCWVTHSPRDDGVTLVHHTQPSPPRTEEKVKESKRRAALRKLGGRAAADDENVVFNPSAFTLALLSRKPLYCQCGGAWSLSLGCGLGVACTWVSFY
ncbi:uncharacterized protein K460DRAFT_58851 [Cucurbitaria berberidis CBS 394.84]|uniref:Uncharacterized protein n=1 Tax=Cucurbitaria berberidis CBS 394.84 TaxID=1168544 RepID=A0A9P4L9X0_9PLEO|nr:uncharacterized protein K460DRAFT_58851 [Cucurbitaria berberidis CBS 394.84]KAF1847475.1 hypothetical protein K460DRAFT_58851 [Cucurbitaria berberidis CBS 394.84]